jgi:hypothetical protein
MTATVSGFLHHGHANLWVNKAHPVHANVAGGFNSGFTESAAIYIRRIAGEQRSDYNSA